jgi:ribonucleoside-diphosphate reductase alpha chain
MDFTNSILENIWKDRYQKNGETFDENLWRVANHCGSNKEEVDMFYDVMKKRYFFPAGRTMSNSGIGKNLTMNNCFVAPQIKDSLDDIFNKVALGAKTHQKGGGIGYDFSQLRPKGSPTTNDAIASGAISFMDVFNSQTATILQGNRRGANMGVMSVYNMDIEEFINAKSYDEGKLNHFNVSVMVDDDFIEAVKSDKNIYLHYPVYSEDGTILKDETKWKYKKEINATYLWDLITKQAYDNGEPGIFFYDNLNKDNNLWYIENIVCTNPCAEYLAGTIYGNSPQTGETLNSEEYGGACNLGSLFLHNFVINPFTKDAEIDYESLKYAISVGVRFLDNVIDINNFPDKIYKNYQQSFRTIGLGVTGLADMLVMLNLQYNTKEAQDFVYNLMDFISYNAFNSSMKLAKDKGSFPYLDRDKFTQSGYLQKHAKNNVKWNNLLQDIKKYGIRNAKIMSIAPTGTLSLTFGNNCSSGIEPIFSLEYERKVKFGGQDEENVKIVKMQDYAFGLWEQVKNGNIVNKDKFITAMEMSVDDHVNMLKNITYHVDMSVSKTINVPTDYSFEDTKDIYLKCHDAGVKGCTIFRPNAIRQGILISDKDKQEQKNENECTKEELPRGYIIQADDNVIGKKRTLTTGCGTLHCSGFFDPATGELLETYFSKGSTGGCNNFMVGLSRMISLSARAGVDIYTIVDQLNSCGNCPSYAVRTATKKDTSRGSCCPVSIGNALLDMYNEIQSELSDDYEYEKPISKHQHIKEIKADLIKNPCPQCGEELRFEGGCNSCPSCGYSKCE